MTIDRRAFLLATAGLVAAQRLRAAGLEDHGLFWSATPPGKPTSILFGYARTAAAVAPTVVADGERLALTCGMVLGDVPNVRFPPISTDLNAIQPITERVPPALAQRIRAYIDGHFAAMPARDRLTGFQLMMMLRGEGQTPPAPSVGGTIAEAAQKSGRPLAYLLTQQEYTAAYHAPDLAALDRRIGPEVIDYLLTLRDADGPLGKYQETLYADRRVGELARLTAAMTAHGVPSVSEISGLPADQLAATIVERAIKGVRNAAAPLFLMLPIGILTDANGVLAKAPAAGVVIKPLG